MRFEAFEDEIQVAVAAADLLQPSHVVHVIVPAGRTPLALFAEILRRAKSSELDLSNTRFVQLDEYVGVPPGDPRSFHSLLRIHLLDPLAALAGSKRKPEQDLLIDGSARDPGAEIARHAARLAEVGGADLAFLGLGRNGHVAFNEPGTSYDQGARVVELAPETRQLLEAEFRRRDAPTRGMTLGLREILASRKIALLATGRSKAAILAALFEAPVSPQRPASILLDQQDFTLFADRAATSALRPPPKDAAVRG